MYTCFFPFTTSRGRCKNFPEFSATMLLTEGYDPAPVKFNRAKDVLYPITPPKFYIEYQTNYGLQFMYLLSKTIASFFSGIYSALVQQKTLTLLQSFATGRSQNCKCRGACVIVYPERPAEDCWGTAPGERGTKRPQQEIHLLKRSWQSSLNFDMFVFPEGIFPSYLLLKIFENHERIVAGIDWLWGPL